jgi:hypothetical protein
MSHQPSTGLWPALESLPTHAAVLVDWRRELGSEFVAARPFLRPAQAPARYYPCTHRPPCECQHRIIDDDPRHIVAVCHCDPPDCPPICLTPQDRLVLALDTRKLCEAIRAALRFQPATPGQYPGAVRSYRLGTYGPAQSPAILSFPAEEGDILAEVGGLCAAIPDPFILLTPTARHHTPAVEAALRRHGCLHFPLAQFVSLAAPGNLTASPEVKPILANFARPAQAGVSRIGQSGSVLQPSAFSLQASPRYSIRKGGGYWTITFDGQDAPKKHEKGLLYVAWLLTNPPKEPIHAMELVAKVPAIYRRQLGLTSMVDEATGKSVALDATAMPQERSHSLDDLEAALRLHKKQQQLEAVMDDDDASEPEKAEALAELVLLYEFQKKHAMRSKGNAEQLVRAVRAAITRLHDNLAKATYGKGQPHPVLRPFADHLAKYLLAPSARFTGRVGSRVRAGVAGRFTYEPPVGVQWTG